MREKPISVGALKPFYIPVHRRRRRRRRRKPEKALETLPERKVGSRFIVLRRNLTPSEAAMPKRPRELDSDSDGSPATASGTAFIDTSLDTHLAMIVSDSDTVVDLKKKIMLEHPKCFPKTGEIVIHALKVKRRGHFYHLSDSMLVKSAFERKKLNWFLSVDASKRLPEIDESRKMLPLVHEPSSMEILSIVPVSKQPSSGDIHIEVSKSVDMEVNRDLPMEDKYDDIGEGNQIVEATSKNKDDDIHGNGTYDFQNDESTQQYSKIGSPPKKRRYVMKKIKDMVSDHVVNDNNGSSHAPCKDGSEKPSTISEHLLQAKHQSNSLISNSQNSSLLEKPPQSEPHLKEICKPKSIEESKNPLGQHKTLLSDSVKDVGQMETTLVPENVSSETAKSRRKRKKDQAYPHDQVADVLPFTLQDGERSINENLQNILKDLSKISVEETVSEHRIGFQNLSEPSIMSQKGKDSGLVQAPVEGDEEGESVTKVIPDIEKQDNVCGNDKSESNRREKFEEENELPMDQSHGEVDEKLRKKVKKKKKKSSATNSLQNLPINEQGNEMESLQPNQINGIQENAENMDKKTKKARKNKNAEANIQTDLQTNDQEEETSKKKKKKKKDKSSMEIPLIVAELEPEKNGDFGNGSLEREEAPMMITDGNRVEASKSEGEAINLKHYLVQGEAREQDDTTANKVKKSISKKKLLIPSGSTDTQNKGGEEKIHVRNPTSIQESQPSNNQHKEILPNSTEKSSKVSGDMAKALPSNDKNQIQTHQAAKQPNPSYPKAAGNESQDDLSSRLKICSGNVVGRSGKKRKMSLDTSTKTTRTLVNGGRKEKRLLSTLGAIFKDASSESSADENMSENSDASTQSPSDKYSSSEYSDGGSVASPETPTNESDGAKVKDGVNSRSWGQKHISMDMILRSSSRFKKAKLTAASESQLEDGESQPVEFVPDSQANM